MKSPFVRFSRFVRSPLSVATLGLCTLWGCRHLPSPRYANEYRSTTFAPAVGGYEEPSVANVIDPNAVEPPIVSLSEDDVFIPLPKEPAPSVAKTDDATPSAPVPMTVVETTPKQEPLPVETPAQKPAATPKLDVPPEPALENEFESKPGSEPQAAVPLPAESKELALNDSDKLDSRAKPAPTPKDLEAVPPLNNEVLSLDSYCDGLVFDAQGFGYVSHKNRIVRFSPTGESSVWATLKSPKGHRIEPEGTHLVCDTERRAVLRLSFEGKLISVAAKECEGAPLRAPYEIAVDPQGGFYFTDPGYVQIKNPIGKLHYVDRSGKVSVVAAKIGYPTGVVYDPARQRVLVAESQFNRILEFRITEPGKVAGFEVFVQLPKSPDSDYHLASLCLDAAGNLYVTQTVSKTVHVFDLQGRPAGVFSTGSVTPSSVALRSSDAEELFLTGDVDARTRKGKVIRLNLGK